MTTEITIEPENEPEPDDTTVVVAPVIVNDDGSSDDNGDTDLAMTVGSLVTAVETLTARVAELDARSSVTETVAEVALETANESIDNDEVIAEAVEEIEPDNEPVKVPWTHRPIHSLFGRD